MLKICRLCLPLLAASAIVGTACAAAQQSNTLAPEEAIALAIANDPWLQGSHYREDALAEEAVAVSALPDPQLRLLAGNLPVDSFELGQEPMTQLAIGIQQRFPPGDSRHLAGRQKRELAEQERERRGERRALLERRVMQLWLDAYRAQESIRLISDNRTLFEQLVEATRSDYAAALGRARQQDLILAQLQLTRLEDRLSRLAQEEDAARQRLGEWIAAAAQRPLARLGLEIDPRIRRAVDAGAAPDRLRARLAGHPSLRVLDRRIAASDTGVELARQQLRPAWGLSAQYGYRDDDPLGNSRADLFSVGVTVDLPLFSADRQQRDINAASARAASLRTERQLLLRRLAAELDTAFAALSRLDERRDRYRRQLLPQYTEQATATLSAYNNDDGDFADALQAQIAELDAQDEALELDIEHARLVTTLHYLLAGADTPATALPPQEGAP